LWACYENIRTNCLEKTNKRDEYLTFNQGVTGSRPVRPTKTGRLSLSGSFEKNQGVKTLGQPTP